MSKALPVMFRTIAILLLLTGAYVKAQPVRFDRIILPGTIPAVSVGTNAKGVMATIHRPESRYSWLMYVSSNAGVTWRSVASPHSSSFVVKVLPSGTLLAVGHPVGTYVMNVARSTNLGVSWNSVYDSHFNYGNPSAIVVGADDRVFIIDQRIVQESSDDGLTWRESKIPAEGPEWKIEGSKIWSTNYSSLVEWDTRDSLRVEYVLPHTSFAVDRHTLFLIDPDSRFLEKASNDFRVRGTIGQLAEGLIAVGNGVFVATTSQGQMVRTTDVGATWQAVLSDLAPIDAFPWRPAEFQEPYLIAGTTSGAARSTDGGATWDTLAIGAAKAPYFFVTKDGAVHTQPVWSQLPEWQPFRLFGSSATFHYTPDQRTLLAIAGGLAASTDEGVSWSQRSIPATTSGSVLFLGFDSVGRFYCAKGRTICITTDLGKTWTTTVVRSAPLYFAATREEIYYADVDGLHRSTDGGVTWVQKPQVIFSSEISGLAADEQGSVYALCQREGVFVYRESAGWDYYNVGLPEDKRLNGIISTAHGELIAATEVGLYTRKLGGVRWRFLESNLFDEVISVKLQDGILYAGTEHSGIYYGAYNARSAVRGDKRAAASIAAYPNPTHGTVMLRGIPDGKKSVTVIDILGRTLLAFETLEQVPELDLSQYPSGVYSIRSTTPTATCTAVVVRR